MEEVGREMEDACALIRSESCKMEDKDFKEGDVKPIRIKKATIPKNTLLLICPYGRHGVGQAISIGDAVEIAMPFELDRSADHALFVAGVAGSVKKDDLI